MRPDGSWGADGFLVYEVKSSSGNCASEPVSLGEVRFSYLWREIDITDHALLAPSFIVELRYFFQTHSSLSM